MQPTKFWHELTEQQQHFLTLLASGEVENVELAKQLFFGLLVDRAMTDLKCCQEYAEKTANCFIEIKQKNFIDGFNLPKVFSGTMRHKMGIFENIALNLRCKGWREYVWGNDFFTYKIHEIEPASHEPVGEIKKIISYPFGYKDKLLCKMIITQSNPTKTQQRISDILAIAPKTTFYFSVGETRFNQGFLEHTKAIEILQPIAQPKKWLINIESVEPMLLHGREPKPNPMYLQLQNTCFCVTKHSNGATNPEQGWLDILAASPEWKERNLTYKFID